MSAALQLEAEEPVIPRTKARKLRAINVDLFAGGGGASVGVEEATGKPIDVALNHDPIAIAVHKANHPDTLHLIKDVWEVKPIDVVGQLCRVDLLWASPDCTHFSLAKGGKPKKQNIRSLAWAVIRWAELPEDQRPRMIFLENVEAFRTWGPLLPNGKPDKARMGQTFKRWCRQLEALGYVVDFRLLDASMFGAPTKRKRLFLIARRDGQPIRWPSPTHGPGLKPYRTAAECIDWSIPCPSIFGRRKPLKEKTMWRIAQGVIRFVLESADPFVVTIDQQGSSGTSTTGADEPVPTIVTKNRVGVVAPRLVAVNHGKRQARGGAVNDPMPTVTAQRRGIALVAPTLIQKGYGERVGQRARVPGLGVPLGTIVAQGQKHALVAAFLAKHYGDPGRTSGGGRVIGSELPKPIGTVTARDHHGLAAVALAHFRGTAKNQPPARSVREPVPTVTAGGTHVGEVRAFLSAYYGNDRSPGKGQDLRAPMRTIRTHDALALVVVRGTVYEIVDIGFRMLEPHELLRAQFGRFAAGYDLSRAVGKKGKKSKAAQVRLIGNSVCPELAYAVVAANVADPMPMRRAA